MQCFLLLVLLIHFLLVSGDYTLSVRIQSYSNPSNRCAGCRETQNCCDVASTFSCLPLCDNEFFYCLRPLGTPVQTLEAVIETVEVRLLSSRAMALQCLESLSPVRTDADVDSASAVEFSGNEYLGVANPMLFEVNAEEWEGIQLYIDVIEDDPVPGIFGINELTDSFALDIEPDTLAANSDTPLLVNGIGVFGFAFVALSFQLECQPGFIGGNCVSICTTDPCSNNGICIQSDTSFTCVCTGDFTGDTCETRIDDCEGVDCNSGTCVDGVMTFTCQCDAGYSGESCDQVITTTSTFIDVTIATPRNGVMPEIATTSTDTVQTFTTAATSSGNIVFVAGAVGGSVAVIITVVAIIIIIIATCCILSVRIRKDSIEEANMYDFIQDMPPALPDRGVIEMRQNQVYGVSGENTSGPGRENQNEVVMHHTGVHGSDDLEQNGAYEAAGTGAGNGDVMGDRHILMESSEIVVQNIAYDTCRNTGEDLVKEDRMSAKKDTMEIKKREVSVLEIRQKRASEAEIKQGGTSVPNQEEIGTSVDGDEDLEENHLREDRQIQIELSSEKEEQIEKNRKAEDNTIGMSAIL